MAESKHTRCKELQCTIREYLDEIAYRENERASISDRLIEMAREIAALEEKSRNYGSIANFQEPLSFPDSTKRSALTMGATISAMIMKEIVDEQISFLRYLSGNHLSNLDAIERRSAELNFNLKRIETARAEECGSGCHPSLVTREDCNLPPIKPMDVERA